MSHDDLPSDSLRAECLLELFSGDAEQIWSDSQLVFVGHCAALTLLLKLQLTQVQHCSNEFEDWMLFGLSDAHDCHRTLYTHQHLSSSVQSANTYASSFELSCVIDTIDSEAAALIEVVVWLHTAQLKFSLLIRIGSGNQLIENVKVSLSLRLRDNTGLYAIINNTLRCMSQFRCVRTFSNRSVNTKLAQNKRVISNMTYSS